MVVTTLKATNIFGIYDVAFYDEHIRTTVTSTASIVDRWIAEIFRIHRRNLHKLLVGLDIERCINFNLKGPQPQPVAILQLCIGHRCLIFHIRRANLIPKSLANFLGNPNFTFVGVDIKTDVNKLEDNCGLWVERIMDLPTIAASKYQDTSMTQMGLKGMARELPHQNMDKPKRVTLSKWNSLYLSAAQIEYACIDAFVSFELGMLLSRMKIH